jgi:hypothetical protein
MASPAAPAEVQEAAAGLRYRDFLTVSLILDGEDLFPDNWIYIHEEQTDADHEQPYRNVPDTEYVREPLASEAV